MTGQSTSRRDESREFKRPSVAALVLLLIGAWASIATSPAESWVRESGEVVIAADKPVLQLSWQSTSDENPEQIQTELWWELTTETGVEAVLSAGFSEEAKGTVESAPVNHIYDMEPQGTIEFVVANPEQTGAVTLAWDMTARVEADQAEMELTVTPEATDRPSAQISLPRYTRSGFDATHAAVVYNIKATVPAGSSSPGLSLKLGQPDWVRPAEDIVATALADGTSTEFAQRTVVPWPDGCAGSCELDVTVVVTSSPGLTADSDDPSGSVTMITRESFQSEPALVELGPAPFLAQAQVFVLDIDLPVGDPAGQQVVFTGTLNQRPDEESYCSVPVSYQLADKEIRNSQFYLGDNWTNYTAALLEKGGEPLEVRVGPASNPEECEGALDDNLTISIGVITYGLNPPAQAKITVR